MTINAEAEPALFDSNAIVRQHIGSTALALFNQAWQQGKHTVALYTTTTMEPNEYVDCLSMKALASMHYTGPILGDLNRAYGKCCEKLSKVKGFNLYTGPLTGDRARRARKFILCYPG